MYANVSPMTVLAGARAVFLQSSPSQQQVQLETNAIEAAERVGSGASSRSRTSRSRDSDEGLHGNHRAVERRLAVSTVAATVVQPSFFTTVLDRQRDLIAKGKVVLPFGTGRVAWVDPDDIAAVAARLGVTRLDPPLAQWRDAVAKTGMDPWLLDSTIDLYAAVARGALDFVAPEVERVLNRPARRAFV